MVRSSGSVRAIKFPAALAQTDLGTVWIAVALNHSRGVVVDGVAQAVVPPPTRCGLLYEVVAVETVNAALGDRAAFGYPATGQQLDCQLGSRCSYMLPARSTANTHP